MYNRLPPLVKRFNFVSGLLLAGYLCLIPAVCSATESNKALPTKKVPVKEVPAVSTPLESKDLAWLERAVSLLAPQLTQTVVSFGVSSSRLVLPDILANLQDVAGKMSEDLTSIDPLDSPHPVPWNWVLTTQAQVNATQKVGVRYYRTPSLISPDGKYAAYSRVQMFVKPELHNSRVLSTLFIENVETGELETIVPATQQSASEDTAQKVGEAANAGQIAILIPISWSPRGDRLLSRQFEGIFSSSDAYDVALVWDRDANKTTTITPQEDGYETTVLLGWSQQHPGRVLFQTSNLETSEAPLWAVDLKGDTIDATSDEPLVLGTILKPLWSGAQLDN